MSNQAIKINLTRIPGVIYTKLTGKTGAQKDCIIIPVEDCHLFVGEKGVYLDLTAIEFKEQKYSDSHMVKQNFSKEAIEELKQLVLAANPNASDDDIKNAINRVNPIIGGVKPIQKAEIQPTDAGSFSPEPDDLPF